MLGQSRKPFLVRGRSALVDLWVEPTWPQQPDLGPWHLEDGRLTIDVMASVGAAATGLDVSFRQVPSCQGKRRGDILWCGGLPIKIVSDRFVAGLTELGVSDFVTYEAPIFDRRKTPIDGYLGFVESVSSVSPVRAHKAALERTTDLEVDAVVVEGLGKLGIDAFELEAMPESR